MCSFWCSSRFRASICAVYYHAHSELKATAEKIAKGDFDVRVKKEKDDELGALCDSINDMAAELGTAEKMKNDFISSVSHELRTPLTAIKGWAETLQTGGIGRETYDKGMNVIVREAERLSGMVEELLDFSRMQSGRMRPDPQEDRSFSGAR